ncbi:MAG: 3-deoxy-manno-octulosonate cytidylyltransferase [Candidatus Brocadiae bacterium]|nr:3-deoxy-manno-octulosonate cytidylyltransferase [Candidatus Brocadiia bacterium]
MKTVIVIPARYASQRLPAKPLLRETGKYLIQHVYESASKSKKAQEIIVATDDKRIYDAVLSFGGRVEMTSEHHKSGTDRMAEVAKKVKADIYVNVQGDEPEINPIAIDDLIDKLASQKEARVATLVYSLDSELAHNPNIVKVVCDKNGYALYFSRARIPYPREGNAESFLGHIGMYAYYQDFLLAYTELPFSQLERIEKLEQLRVLESGYKIITALTSYRSQGIDTREDYDAFIKRYTLCQRKTL